MLILLNVMGVTVRDHMDKKTQQNVKVADVYLAPSDGGQPLMSTIWSEAVVKGEHKQYQELVGKEALISGRFKVWQGNLQFELNTNVKPKLINAPKAA